MTGYLTIPDEFFGDEDEEDDEEEDDEAEMEEASPAPADRIWNTAEIP